MVASRGNLRCDDAARSPWAFQYAKGSDATMGVALGRAAGARRRRLRHVSLFRRIHDGDVLAASARRPAKLPEAGNTLPAQSCGSTLTVEAPSLLPTQNDTGVVELSTKTRRMLV